MTFQDHRSLRIRGDRDRAVCPSHVQRTDAAHYVRGAAQRGHHTQAVSGRVHGSRGRRTHVRRGAICQTHLPLPLTQNHD